MGHPPTNYAEGKNNEEHLFQLGRFLRISLHIGMPSAFTGLGWYMENESLEEQLSGPDCYYLDFGGRRISLRLWNIEYHFPLRWEGPTGREQWHTSLREKQRHRIGFDPKRQWGKDECVSLGAFGRREGSYVAGDCVWSERAC